MDQLGDLPSGRLQSLHGPAAVVLARPDDDEAILRRGPVVEPAHRALVDGGRHLLPLTRLEQPDHLEPGIDRVIDDLRGECPRARDIDPGGHSYTSTRRDA